MRFSYWSAIGAAVAAIGYGVAQVLQLLGVLPDPIDRIAIFAPSLALAPCFVATLAAAHAAAPEGYRTLRLTALAFGTLYAAFVSSVYVNQLGVVIPREIAGASDGYARLACCGFREPMTAIDLLGYTYMSVALILLVPGARGVLRWSLVAGGERRAGGADFPAAFLADADLGGGTLAGDLPCRDAVAGGVVPPLRMRSGARRAPDRTLVNAPWSRWISGLMP